MSSRSLDRVDGWVWPLLLGGLLVAWAAEARAGVRPAGGFGAELLVGTDFCVPHGGADCDEASSSFAFAPTLTYRMRKHYALFLTFHFDRFEVPRDRQMFQVGAFVGGRIYVPLGYLVEPFIEAGLGWGRTQESGHRWTSSSDGLQVAGGAGVQLRLTDVLSVGVAFTYHMPQVEHSCGYLGCWESPASFARFHTLILGVTVTGWLENIVDPVVPDLRVPIDW
jgi:hypothetical protein